jgi:hypothetical protein
MLHGLMVRVWSIPLRIISPWLMSWVQAVPSKVTLFARANGFVSVSLLQPTVGPVTCSNEPATGR